MSAVVVPLARLRPFLVRLCSAAGLDPGEAEHLIEATVWCDLADRKTQGIWRLPAILERVRRGGIRSPCEAVVERTGPSTARLDGRNGLGYHLGTLAMNAAVSIAGETGVGAVGVLHGNHLGAGAYYGNLAASRGQVGLALSNSFPKVAAQGGTSAVLGTNPFSIAFPNGSRPILIDFSTSPRSGAAVRRDARASGKTAASSTTQPADGIKGYCMGLVVEILAGVLTGAGVSTGVGSMFGAPERPADAGHFFLALDPERFVGRADFERRMDSLATILRASLPAVEGREVRVPGDARWDAFEEQSRSGINYARKDLGEVERFASSLQVATPW